MKNITKWLIETKGCPPDTKFADIVAEFGGEDADLIYTNGIWLSFLGDRVKLNTPEAHRDVTDEFHALPNVATLLTNDILVLDSLMPESGPFVAFASALLVGQIGLPAHIMELVAQCPPDTIVARYPNKED